VDPIRPQPELPPDPAAYKRALGESRKEFTTLLLENMRAPDGSYEDGFVAPGGENLPARTLQPGNLERNNPLSLHDEVRASFDRSDDVEKRCNHVESGSILESVEGVVCSC